MAPRFITYYLIIVLITSPFFLFLPPLEKLAWHEMLLAKILNQAPAIFLIIYLCSQVKKVKRMDIFLVLLAFLFSCLASEVYYYLIEADSLFIASVINNILTYMLLISIFFQKNISFESSNRKLLFYAFLTSLLVVTGFSFSIFHIYNDYLPARKFVFFTLNLFILTTVLTVFLSFFIGNPFDINWYKHVIGVCCLVAVDIYTYTSIFVFNSSPTFIYTLGKVVFSMGLLLLVDGLLRKGFYNKSTLKAS